ncbi:MAG TPA: TetR/AcrR family transcriptional regulator [Thermoanaerobaculaceae bacterium]|nr:TetR/AcrR family transcriptional regulator [Thermoanaerobaculaceae bacterium]
MNQAEKSQRSREHILEAALQLFSSQGYRATSVRDIAAGAGVSTGNVYHHFPDKETIYLTLLDQYWEAIDDPNLPFNRALATGTFPDNLEEVGHASRELVRVYRRHVALIYVDVVEFEGSHIRKFYAEMAQRYASFMATHDGAKALAARLRPGISPASAAMFATRFYINYFAVEILFGVPNHFGKDSEAVIRETADILRHGMLRSRA